MIKLFLIINLYFMDEQKQETSAPEAPKKEKRGFLNSGIFPLLAGILFGLAYMAVYWYLKPSAADIGSTQILDIFKKYGMYVGWAFALISMVGLYILYGLKALFRLGRFGFLNPVLMLAAIFPWYFFADQLLHHEKRYTDIARGIISFVGSPLHYSVLVMSALSGLWFVLALLFFIFKKKS